jgi:hypothetical protein
MAVSKKTRIITRSRYSAPIYRGKENGDVRFSSQPLCSVRCPQRIDFDTATQNPLRTADTTAPKKENSAERLAKPG